MTLTQTSATDALGSGDLLALGMEADALRRRLHPQNTVTYTLETAAAWPGAAQDDWEGAAERALEAGCTDLLLEYDGRPSLGTLSEAEQILRLLRGGYPQLALHGFSAREVLRFREEGGPELQEAVSRLREAGLSSLGAGGAGLLDARFRTPGDPAPAAWLEVHRAAHAAGLPSFAAMTIGRGEDAGTRAAHLHALRRLQEETGGFTSFVLHVHHPASAQARREEEATAVDYLKTLAVARLTLDNIPHIEAEWAAQGPKVLELALRFGANDAGAVHGRAAAREPSHHSGEAELRRIIRDAGFRPVLRDRLYRQSFPH